MNTTYKLKIDESFVGPSKVIMLQPLKQCAQCQKIWRRVPAVAIQNEMGYWWNCNCDTTMFWSLNQNNNFSV